MNRFRANPGFEREIVLSATARAAINEAAAEVARLARSMAPSKTGRYKRSISVENDADSTFVATSDIAGHIVEFGSANNPAYAPIRRAARAAGLRVTDETT